MKQIATLYLAILALCATADGQTSFATKTLSGVIVTSKNEVVPEVTITVKNAAGQQTVITDAEGRFSLTIPREAVTLVVSGKNIATLEKKISASDSAENLRLEIEYAIPKVHDSLVITATQLDPTIDRRNDAIYRDTLFSRDDQVFHTLDAGINAGQHEGGGKSLEIRRFGYNLDHGGVNGGLKVLVDNFQQNQGTQGHGQGYLGQLKSLTPELVDDVEILNGPFSAQYGDFSGLGVVHIRLKESLPDQLTARFQGGEFGTFRSFLAYSPQLKSGDALIAYEASRTDGPFKNPLNYKRDNITGNYIRNLNERNKLGFKLNLGRNDFVSSGQIPLDEVFAGRLDRFGFIDPDNGGHVRTGVFNAYYRHESAKGGVLKVDGFLARSLFDLYSDFTFFLNDETNGDEIVQHDSRLQEGLNAQVLQPYKLFGHQALFVAGANFHDNQINVGLDHSVGRSPISVVTKANARVTNIAGYVQQGIDLVHGHVHVEAGLRFDHFRFEVDDNVDPLVSGVQGASRFQPKFNLSVTPADRLPLAIYFNYGRGISSQDARGVVQHPDGERISTTDFYQVGTSHHFNRLSLSTDLFLIDRSNEQVYIPDDGSFEFQGPTRAYGFEAKASVKLTKFVSFNGGLTRVMNAFYRGQQPRVYVDSAPHFISNAALTMSGWRGFSGSLRYRHIGNYRLDGEDPMIRAAGFDVIDLSVNKRITQQVEFNLSVDNLTDKHYYETQNYFESRLAPGAPVESRIHATPGYPLTVTAGVTFRFFGK
ncbi:MAG: TonB-dependent receptor [Acidobacteria bacterium]|nr:TonB-dependent receptor [Acidobacteriota bacterium]